MGDDAEKQAHFVETNRKMQIAPHLTPADMHKAFTTMRPPPADGSSTGVERFHAETTLKAAQRQAAERATEQMTVDGGRRRLPAITRKFYDEVVQMCCDLKQLLVVRVLGNWSKQSTDMEKA